MGRFIFVLLLSIAAILYTVWLFEVVMASDLPGWLEIPDFEVTRVYKIEIQRWIDYWTDCRVRWRSNAILDGCLMGLQTLQGIMYWKQDRYILGGVLIFMAGVMAWQVWVCVRHMRAIAENVAGLEEVLNENDNMV